MATTIGTEYDHIDITNGVSTIRHPLKDASARENLVKVQDTQPQSNDNVLWIKETPESEVQVPTYNEFQEVSGDVSNLKSALNDIIDTAGVIVAIATKASGSADMPEGFTTELGYLRDMSLSNPGNASGTSSSKNHIFYCVAAEAMDVYVDWNYGSQRQICIFSGAPYGTSNRVTDVYSNGTQSYPLPTADTPLHVDAGQYITFSCYNASTSLADITWTLYKVTSGSSSLKSTLPLTEKMSEQVDEGTQEIKGDILQTGYFLIPSDNWARHAWTSHTTTDSRNYRVRCKLALEFNNPVIMLADKGFHISGYTENGGAAIGPVSRYELPANTKLHLFIRRVDEDDTETANVAEFANALKIQTKLSDISLYKPTFSDVSMFEHVGVCGDSYASGGGIISGVTALTWGKNLERQAGISVDIYAKSGQTVAEWLDDNIHGLPALLAGTECGLYWLQHGINIPDAGLGTPADMEADPRPATFYGAYAEAIEQIKTTFPTARIVLANIIGSHYDLYQTIYEDVNEAIENIAEYCEVPMIDVAADDFYRSSFYTAYIASNHPTAMQCAGIAMANRRLISKCIQDNPSYFIAYGSD